MKKRLMAMLMLMSIFLCWVPGEVFAEDTNSGTCGENLSWTLWDGTLTISGTGKMYDFKMQAFGVGELQPWVNSSNAIKKIIIEDGVTYIGSNAFSETTATSVQMADSVTEIGGSVFSGCIGLKSIMLSDAVREIGDSAFSGCISLGSIILPEGLMEIGRYAFSGCASLESVTLPFGVTKVGYGVFYGCTSLQSVTLSESVMEIGGRAFSGCISLQSVTLSERVAEIGGGAFSGCANLECFVVSEANPNYAAIDGALYSKDAKELICFPAGYGANSYAVPDSVQKVGDNAFEGCDGLESITLPDGVIEIGERAFYNCTGLESIVLPDGVTKIGKYAFNSCTAMESITLPEGLTWFDRYAFENCTSLKRFAISQSNPNYTSIDGVLYSKDVKELICFPAGYGVTTYIVPDSVQEIGMGAFEGCIGLESVTLPEGLTKIDWYTFSGCTRLKSIALPDSVVEIVDEAFSGCTSLESVTLPDGLEIIGMGAFADCTSLNNITMSNGLRAIGSGAFMNCTSLKSVALPEGLTTIWSSTFNGCTSLESVTLPEGLTEILGGAFSGCTNLHSITIPATVTEIDDYALGFDYDDEISEDVKMDDFEISGHAGSAADTYAEKYGFNFHAVHFYDDGVMTKEPTCTNEGEKLYTCTVCGKTKKEPVAATGHSWDKGTVTEEPTATEQGEKTYTCQTCGETKTEAIAVLGNPFTDLVETSSYYNAVLWAVDKGITKGTSETEFSPKEDCTRAQIVTFLWRYAGEPEPTSTKHEFVDLVEDSSYYKAVLWAVEQGITNGLDDTHFGPKEPCTRAQIVTFLWRAAGKPQPSSKKHSFTDIVKGSSYYDAVLWAVEKGITTGADSTHFNPKDTCTRAQGMTFLYRYHNTK